MTCSRLLRSYPSGPLAGACGAVVFVVLAASSSPGMVLVVLVGIALLVAMFAYPFFAFMVTAFVVPLERFGRFTNDSSVLTISIMKVLGVVAAASLLLHCFLYKRRMHLPLPIVLYGIYFCLAVASLIYTTDTPNGLRAISVVAGNLLFLFLIVNVVRTRRQAELGVGCMLVSTLIIGLVTIEQYHQPKAAVEEQKFYMGAGELTTANRFDMVIYDGLPGTPNRARRAIGATSHPAVCAINLILTLPFYAYFCRFGRMWMIRWGAAVATIVACYNVFLTNTRAAIVTMAAVVALIFLTGLIRFRPRFLLGAIAIAALVLVANPADVWRRSLDFSRYSTGAGEVQERVMMWHAALETIGDNWILGCGVGNQTEAVLRVRTPTVTTSVHNDVLAILLETGVGGFLILAAFLFSLHARCRAAERLLGARGDESGSFLATAARITMYAVLLYGVQVDTLSLPLKAFWLAMGLAISHADQVVQGLSPDPSDGATR